ncbi:MAG: spermidine synthase [Actinomycetota bacterium]
MAEAIDAPLVRRANVRLVVLSFLMLFVELGLIRWAGAYNVYISFFTNFILLASFLGVGVGFLRSGGRSDLFRLAPVSLAAFVVFLAVFPVQGGRVGGVLQVVGGFGWPALPKWVSLSVIFALSFLVMAAIAQGVARVFARYESLEAYRLDILGSILGIVAFSVLAFVDAPPLAWGGVVSIALVLVTAPRRRRDLAPLAVVLVVLGALSFAPRTFWSPYQRITISGADAEGSVGIEVNGRPHQRIMPVSFMETDQAFRFVPYDRVTDNPLRNVLIIGAGSGNDVAIALSKGAEHVDAVEIDPILYRLGVDLHPDRPYQDPRVSAHVEDGRAFLHDTDREFDLVLFAIPDSLAALAGQSSLRLESFLFTEEAMREVRDHLAPGGAVAMYHYYLPIVVDRYGDTLDRVFGGAPCLDVSRGAGARGRTVITASVDPGAVTCDDVWQRPPVQPTPETDDFPFPYLLARGIPGSYQIALLSILAASVLAVRVAGGPLRAMRSYVDLFFMGAAFLLLETTNVVRFALLFGTTWFVNALVFAGILVSVYLAIEVTRRWPVRRPSVLYVPLFVAIAIAWVVPLGPLLALDPIPRFVAAVALGFTPVFIGNLVFANRFRDVGSSTIAFGTNLLGAMVGGLLEYGALVVGYRSLLVGVAALYAAALFTGRSHLSRAGTTQAVDAEPPSRARVT